MIIMGKFGGLLAFMVVRLLILDKIFQVYCILFLLNGLVLSFVWGILMKY